VADPIYTMLVPLLIGVAVGLLPRPWSAIGLILILIYYGAQFVSHL
jgi:hypothetical protein